MKTIYTATLSALHLLALCPREMSWKQILNKRRVSIFVGNNIYIYIYGCSLFILCSKTSLTVLHVYLWRHYLFKWYTKQSNSLLIISLLVMLIWNLRETTSVAASINAQEDERVWHSVQMILPQESRYWNCLFVDFKAWMISEFYTISH